MKKNMKKILLSSVAALGFAAIGVSTTFALFTSSAENTVNISSGKISVGYSVDGLQTYSVRYNQGQGDRIDENGIKYQSVETDVNGVFTNGGTASYANNILNLNNITPGDRVAFSVAFNDQSTVSYKYRLVYELIDSKAGSEEDPNMTLARGLSTKTDISGSDTTYVGLKKYASEWKEMVINQNQPSNIAGFNFDIELPVNLGNAYQEKSAQFKLSLEAVQLNAYTDDTGAALILLDNYDEETVPATPTDVEVETQYATTDDVVNVTVPAANFDGGETVELVVTDVDLSQEGTLDLDVSLYIDGELASSLSSPATVKVYIGEGKEIISVYHKEVAVTQYSYENGYVIFTTDSFSPFQVNYLNVNGEYGFYNSYVQDGHWVHEIKTKAHFKNIVTHINAHGAKAEDSAQTAKGYKLADYTTVYLIKNDIDFGGELWGEEYLNNNTLPIFTGTLKGNSEVVISNLQNYATTSRSVNEEDGEPHESDKKLIGLFGLARNAVFENITLDNMILDNPDGKNAGLFAYGNNAEDGEPNYTNGGSLAFVNCTINNTCYVSGKSSLAAFIASGRSYKSLTFDGCTNNANVYGSAHAVAAFVSNAAISSNDQSTKDVYTFKNCVNNGTLVGSFRVGTLCGYIQSNKHIAIEGTNVNNGDIYSTTANNDNGCFFGRVDAEYSFGSSNDGMLKNGRKGNIYVQDTDNISTRTEYVQLGGHIYDKDGNAVTVESYTQFFVAGASTIKAVGVSFNENNNYQLALTNLPDNIASTSIIVSVDTVLSKYDGTDYPEKVYGSVIQEHVEFSSTEFTAQTMQSSVYQIKHAGYFVPDNAEVYNDTLSGTINTIHLLDNSLKENEAYSNGWHFSDDGHSYVVVTNENADGTFYHCVTHWRLRITYTISFYDADHKLIGVGSYYDGWYDGDINESTITAIPAQN